MMRVKAAILIMLSLFFSEISAQMPEWKIFRDREGNRYYLDQAGKIIITEKLKLDLTPVSSLGIDYHLNRGLELLRDHHPAEGLAVLKAIESLTDENARITDAQKKASAAINRMKKREGERFDRIDSRASIFLIKENEKYSLINDRMRYSFKSESMIHLLRRKDRTSSGFVYSGLQFGIKGDEKLPPEKFDMLVAVDSEKGPLLWSGVEQAEDKWRETLGSDIFKRERISSGLGSSIYFYSTAGEPSFYGYEGIYASGKITHIVRIIIPGRNIALKEKALGLIRSFTVVSD